MSLKGCIGVTNIDISKGGIGSSPICARRYVVAHVAVGLKAYRSVSVNILCQSICKLIIY